MIYLFCCQGHLKQLLENYQFCRKSKNEANGRGWESHAICVIMTHSVKKSICDSPLIEMCGSICWMSIDFYLSSVVITSVD